MHSRIPLLILLVFLILHTHDASAQKKGKIVTTYYPSGEKFEEGPMKKGFRQGEWKTYAIGGKVLKRTTYSKGVRQGPEVVYAGYGQQIKEANYYRSDSLHGIRYVYTVRGKLDSVLHYKQGRLDGWQRTYGGSFILPLKSKYFMRNDSLLCRRSYENHGRLHSIEYFRNGELHGECLYYSIWSSCRDSAYVQSKMYRDGVLHGEVREYTAAHALWLVSNYVDGNLHGPYIRYDYSGRLATRSEYANGAKNGEEVNYMYYSQGGDTVKTIDHYLNGVRNGLSVTINQNHDTTEWAWYDHGKLDSAMTMEYPESGAYVKTKISLVRHDEEQSRYMKWNWTKKGVLSYKGEASASTGSGPWIVDFDGHVIYYYDNGNKKVETWSKDRRPDSLFRSWHENGKQQVVCKVIRGYIAAQPQIWNEGGVKLKAGTQEYNQIFGDVVARSLQVNPKYYDPEKDNITYVTDDSRIIEEMIGDADNGMEKEVFSPDTTVYTSVDELPRIGTKPEGFDEYMIEQLPVQLLWMEDLPQNDSIVISFIITQNGKADRIKIDYVANGWEGLAKNLQNSIGSSGTWCPAHIKNKPVRFRMNYVLRFDELERWMSGTD